jgi:hypothetical protein
MNAHDLSTPSFASAALPSSNPGLTPALDLAAARTARDGLRSLLGAERSAAAEFLLALADFDARRGWESLGYSSLFAFLKAELGLSNGGAFWRMSAARLLQRHPQVIEPLRDGRLCMSTTAELARVATEENLAEVLPRFYGLSAREAKEITAELLPRESPPVREVVTQLGAARTLPFNCGGPQPEFGAGAPFGPTSESVRTFELEQPLLTRSSSPPAVLHPAPPRTEIEPLTADLRRLHVTVDREFLAMLDSARDGLSHALPNATAEQVLRAGLAALLDRQAKQRGLVTRPRKNAPCAEIEAPASEARVGGPNAPERDAAVPVRHRREGQRQAIPAAVKRAVWTRDGGRCCWPLDGGGTCGSTHRLELDHILPWAKGGEETVGNLRVVCRAHNAVASRASFGARVAGSYASSA